MAIKAQQILNFISSRPRSSCYARELADHFRLSARERKGLHRQLNALAAEGRLVKLRGGRYALPEEEVRLTGALSVHRHGYGFVRSEAEGQKDVFIPGRFMHGAMHGDRVEVGLAPGADPARPEGKIHRVLERAHRTVVGRYAVDSRGGYLIPVDTRMHHELLIPGPLSHKARPGQMVVARIEAYPGRMRPPEGRIVEVLGDADDPRVELLAIAHKHGLPTRFPAEVLAEAEALPTAIDEADLAGRRDLRELGSVTIDGETAKDFDDAVMVSAEPQGGWRLWVSIADVGHYLPEGGLLDREARERGTSVYFPGHCLPMIPEALSNGLCSLNPDVDRLTLTAELLFDETGRRLESRFYPSVIRSRARLTYEEVRDLLEGRADADLRSRCDPLMPMLKEMAALAGRLTDLRRQRGSLDFDLPEAEIVLDLTGRPENILRSERTVAHRLIEEFMLAANEAVAGFLTESDAPLLYRVHESPLREKLEAFQEFLSHFNLGLEIGPDGVSPLELQQLLEQVEGRPEGRIINHVLLRTMKQAHYAPENLGHFGLAAPTYCHFTSPIRRYPDLVVHRVLAEVLQKGSLPVSRRTKLAKTLPALGELTSALERRAADAERESVEMKKCQVMASRIGESFSGIVAGVEAFGLFVELQEVYVEGLVHISELGDDYYHFEADRHRLVGERFRRIFQVGEPIRVRVAHVSVERREIDFVLDAPATGDAGQGPDSDDKLTPEKTPSGRGRKRKGTGGRRR